MGLIFPKIKAPAGLNIVGAYEVKLNLMRMLSLKLSILFIHALVKLGQRNTKVSFGLSINRSFTIYRWDLVGGIIIMFVALNISFLN